MANAFKCTRCGNYYDPYVKDAYKYHAASLYGYSLGSLYDLCPDCTRKLNRFMKGEELIHDSGPTTRELRSKFLTIRKPHEHDFQITEVSNIIQSDDFGYPLTLVISTCRKCGESRQEWIDVSKGYAEGKLECKWRRPFNV